jgi:hypothetical protein
MTTHAPCALKGPVTLERPWWAKPARKRRRKPSTSRIRTALVARVRREIASGTYDTPDKWNKALDNLFCQLSAE